MFTGLIEEVGVVRRLERGTAGGKLSVRARTVLEGTKIGDSIAVSGACLTVIALDADGFVVECMPETLIRTTLGQAGPGSLVNLERSLRWGDRLGGHLVLGHVDAVGEVLRRPPGRHRLGGAGVAAGRTAGRRGREGVDSHRRHLAHGDAGG